VLRMVLYNRVGRGFLDIWSGLSGWVTPVGQSNSPVWWQSKLLPPVWFLYTVVHAMIADREMISQVVSREGHSEAGEDSPKQLWSHAASRTLEAGVCPLTRGPSRGASMPMHQAQLGASPPCP
jgi:hypothetical protein